MTNRRRGGFQTRPVKTKQTGRFETCPYVRYARWVWMTVLPFTLRAALILPAIFLADTHHATAQLESGMAADVVLGQPDFVSSSSGTTVSKLNAPLQVASGGKRLVVSDGGNHRVLIWNKIPTKNNVLPDFVLGQTNFVSGAANTGGRTLSTFNGPTGLFTDGNKLMVADRNNHRILIWNTFPTKNAQAAEVVIGQTNGTIINTGTSQTLLNIPSSVFFNEERVVISDRNNNRVLIYNQIPTTNNVPADVVIGQPDFTSNTGTVSASGLSGPVGATIVGEKLIIADRTNLRYLVYNSIPTSNGTPADVVIGQPDMDTAIANFGGQSARSMSCSGQIGTDGEKLFLVDRHGVNGANQRILVFNEIPTKNFQPADFVLGKPNFSEASQVIDARTYSDPHGVFFDGRRVVVVDQGAHRILITHLTGGGDINLGPQFSQGKAVVGKVYWDFNANGKQDD